jgi:hypothetical protein
MCMSNLILWNYNAKVNLIFASAQYNLRFTRIGNQSSTHFFNTSLLYKT